MKYDQTAAVDTAAEASFAELEAFFNSLTATPAKPQLSAQERVEVRRQVEEILSQRDYDAVYGDPLLETC